MLCLAPTIITSSKGRDPGLQLGTPLLSPNCTFLTEKQVQLLYVQTWGKTMDFISGFYFICSNFLTHFAMILCRTRSNHSSTLDVIVGNAASPQVTIRLLRKSHHNRCSQLNSRNHHGTQLAGMGFYQWVQLGYMGARMETFWFTLTYWCTPSSGTVRFTPECTNVPQPRCTEVPNSSGLRYSVPGRYYLVHPGLLRYVELRCSEGKKRFSRQFATRHCTALYLTLYLTTEHCTPTSTCCTASPGGMQGSTQQCRKLKCSLFQKGNPSLSRRGTCWL